MNDENIKSEDYISPPSIRKLTIQFLRFIFEIVDTLLGVFKNRTLLLLTGLILGLAFGYYRYLSRSANFEISMIGQTSTVHRKTLVEIVQSLNELIFSSSYVTLAKELGVSEQQTRKLRNMELTGLMNESLENDTSSKYDLPFKIIVGVSNPEPADSFQNGIVHYLENKPSLKKSNEEEIKFHNEKLSFIDGELAKLDTLKTVYNRYLASPKITATYYSNNVDPSNLYKRSADLLDEKGKVMSWLSANSKPILVIDEFKTPVLPKGISRLKSLFYYALIGIGVFYFLGLYMELHRKFRIYERKA
jgi:hypothetical protein